MTLHELEQNLAQALKGKGLGGPRHISRRLVDRGQSEGFTLEVLWKVLDLPLQPEDFYEYVVSKAFPESRRLEAAQYAPYFPVVLSLYRLFCEYQRTVPGDSFVQRHPLRFLEEEEIAALPDEEYRRFLQAFHDDYIYEIMQLSSEIHGYNTLDHVLGVHDLALSLARQYKKLGYPVDLGRVSGAAAGHDIGKFGVMKKDAKKVPYLHYYYSDVWFRRHDIHYIRNIAVNHSTWDLELENLSLESLILIFSDFRVKNLEGVTPPKMHIYPLEQSFQVILNKLDNVDEAKRRRYVKVYEKLHDFGSFTEAVGVCTTPGAKEASKPSNLYGDDLVLRFGSDLVLSLRFFAVDHNIGIMHQLRDEKSLASFLEAARSTTSWQDLREYVRIFEEYTTYLTARQKIQTLKFLTENLLHPEDDIRLNSIRIIGDLIAHFDEDYRKELPDGVVPDASGVTGPELFRDICETLLHPSGQLLDIHRHRLGYSLSQLIESLFPDLPPKDPAYIKEYSDLFLSAFHLAPQEDPETSLFLLEAAKYLPKAARSETFPMVKHFLQRGDRWQIILCLELIGAYEEEDYPKEDVGALLRPLIHREELGLTVTQLLLKLSLTYLSPTEHNELFAMLRSGADRIALIFLSNLKTATHWSLKRNQLKLLSFYSITREEISTINTAFHFCNIMKVSAYETVRRSAGDALLALLPHLNAFERNEVAVELLRALEIEGQRFTEYIPYYLGRAMLFLEDRELNELLEDMAEKIKAAKPELKGLILKTTGVALAYYRQFENRFAKEHTKEHLKTLTSMLMGTLADPSAQVRYTAMTVLGRQIFANPTLSMEKKATFFQDMAKKMVVLSREGEKDGLTFMSNAAAFNHIYRFMGDYEQDFGALKVRDQKRYAFFAGTFDPFTRSHGAIARLLRDMGYEVYLAVDEFSWSKKTLPNGVRRQILAMTVAGEEDLYVFPQSLPINLANDNDVRVLQKHLGQDVAILCGSDVVLNASAYQTPHLVQSLPHIVFLRQEDTQVLSALNERLPKLTPLQLPRDLKTISSSQIRANIDENRDISTLIDPLAQRYIYDNGFYQKAGVDKRVASFPDLELRVTTKIEEALTEDLSVLYEDPLALEELIRETLRKPSGRLLLLKDCLQGTLVGLALVHWTRTSMYYKEIGDVALADALRHTSLGRLATVDFAAVLPLKDGRNHHQILLTETLAFLIAKDYEYCLFHPKLPLKDPAFEDNLSLYNFTRYEKGDEGFYLVNMTTPVALNLDMENILKEPFRSNPLVQQTIAKARVRLQSALGALFPGEAIIPLEPFMLHQAMIRKITAENKVPMTPTVPRTLGGAMCVPYGDLLEDYLVPNTVTKALHTEKYFEADLQHFSIRELPFYLNLENQVKTIKSFRKDLILVDTILHKGYRMKALDPLLKKHHLKVRRIICGIMSARGKDLMESAGYRVHSVYYFPRMRAWFNENQLYPFLGGDALWRGRFPERNLLPSINLILPYTAPSFLKDRSAPQLYALSCTAHENALSIFSVIESEFNRIYDRKLTLMNLGQVLTIPRALDLGPGNQYDLSQSPSTYLANNLEALVRLEGLFSPPTP